MYYSINKWTLIVALICLVFKMQVKYLCMFCIEHPNYTQDVFIFSLINGIGQLFIYELIKKFKQHIPAFVIAIRKCVTVVINIVWYGHEVNPTQLIGLVFVFAAVMA